MAPLRFLGHVEMSAAGAMMVPNDVINAMNLAALYCCGPTPRMRVDGKSFSCHGRQGKRHAGSLAGDFPNAIHPLYAYAVSPHLLLFGNTFRSDKHSSFAPAR